MSGICIRGRAPGTLAQRLGVVVSAVGALALGAGCDSLSGTPTEASCDQSLELSWETFGKDFMDAYCVRCHGALDSQSYVQSHRGLIDELAGIGPHAANRQMPQSGLAPNDDERQLLATWLACGAP